MGTRKHNAVMKESRTGESDVVDTQEAENYVARPTPDVVQKTSVIERAQICISDPFIADTKDWQDVLLKEDGDKYDHRSIQRWRSRQEPIKVMGLAIQILFFGKRFIAKRKRYFDPHEDAIDRELLNIYGTTDKGIF